MEITIGITAYNEEKNIGKLLNFLLEEKFNFNLKEIIVVASGCTDRTVDIIKEFVKKKIKLIAERKRRGKSSAINMILKKAKGDIIVFICADNLPKKDSINKLVKNFYKKDIGSVSGRPIPIEDKNTLFGYVSNLIWKLHHEACLKNPKISGELFAIKNGIIKKIPYDIINDDGYITALVKKLSYKLIYEPAAITYMIGKNNLQTHIRRRRRIARGYIQLKELGLDINTPPKLIYKNIIKIIKEEQYNIIKIIFAVFLELIANLLAFYDTLIGNTPYCWKR
jgi:glycosyltransferase involved in cell wall biosynthesis